MSNFKKQISIFFATVLALALAIALTPSYGIKADTTIQLQDAKLSLLSDGSYKLELLGELDEGEQWAWFYLTDDEANIPVPEGMIGSSVFSFTANTMGEAYWKALEAIVTQLPDEPFTFDGEMEQYNSGSGITNIFNLPANSRVILFGKTYAYTETVGEESITANYRIATIGGFDSLPEQVNVEYGNQFGIERIEELDFDVEYDYYSSNYVVTVSDSLIDGESYTWISLDEETVKANNFGQDCWNTLKQAASGTNETETYSLSSIISLLDSDHYGSTTSEPFAIPSDTQMLFVAKTVGDTYKIHQIGGTFSFPRLAEDECDKLGNVLEQDFILSQDFQVTLLESGDYKLEFTGTLKPGEVWTYVGLNDTLINYGAGAYCWNWLSEILDYGDYVIGDLSVDDIVAETISGTLSSADGNSTTISSDIKMLFVGKTKAGKNIDYMLCSVGGTNRLPIRVNESSGNVLGKTPIGIQNFNLSLDYDGSLHVYSDDNLNSDETWIYFCLNDSEANEFGNDFWNTYEALITSSAEIDSASFNNFILKFSSTSSWGTFNNDSICIPSDTRMFFIGKTSNDDNHTIKSLGGTNYMPNNLIRYISNQLGMRSNIGVQDFTVSVNDDGTYLVSISDELKDGESYTWLALPYELASSAYDEYNSVAKYFYKYYSNIINNSLYIFDVLDELYNSLSYNCGSGFVGTTTSKSFPIPGNSAIVFVAKTKEGYSPYNDYFNFITTSIGCTYNMPTGSEISTNTLGKKSQEDDDSNTPAGIVVSSHGSLDGANTSRNLAVDSNGNIYIAYRDTTDGCIYITKTTNSGKTFSIPVKVSDLPGYECEVACSTNGYIYVSFVSNEELYIAYSSDKASSFTTVYVDAYMSSAHIAVDGDNVYSTSSSGNIFYYSHDGGRNYSKTYTGSSFAYSDILIDKDTHNVILIKDKPEIEYYVSEDFGETFTVTNYTDFSNVYVYYSTAAYGGTNIYFSGMEGFMLKINPLKTVDTSSIDFDPFSKDTGNIEYISVPISSAPLGRSLSADDKGNIVTGYVSGLVDLDVCFVTSGDSGATWSDPVTVAVATAANAAMNPINGDILFLYEADGELRLVVKSGYVKGYDVTTDPALLSFASTDIANDVKRTFNILNNGEDSVTVTSITATEGFEPVFSAAFDVTAGGKITVSVKYTDATIKAGTITITYDGTNTITLPIQVYEEVIEDEPEEPVLPEEPEEPAPTDGPAVPIIIIPSTPDDDEPTTDVPGTDDKTDTDDTEGSDDSEDKKDTEEGSSDPSKTEEGQPTDDKKDDTKTDDKSGETEHYTIPVTAEDTVQIDADITDNIAVVSEITPESINETIKNSKPESQKQEEKTDEDTPTEVPFDEEEQGNVPEQQPEDDSDKLTIDLSEAEQDVTGITLTKESVENISNAIKDDTNDLEALKFKMTDAEVEFDGAALDAISEQAEGDTLKLVVEDTDMDKYTEDQKESLLNHNVISSFEAYIESNGQRIHDFKGGSATVSIRFTPAPGTDPKHYHIFYVAKDGLVEQFITRFFKGYIQFTTGHFSDYVITYDESLSNETADDYDPTAYTDDDEDITDSSYLLTDESKYDVGIKLNSNLNIYQRAGRLIAKWGEVEEADGYYVYAAYCGETGYERVAVIKGSDITKCNITTIHGEPLDMTRFFKVYVVAYKNIDGKNRRIGTSLHTHVAGMLRDDYTNIRKINLETKKATLSAGETMQVNATYTVYHGKEDCKLIQHISLFRFRSSDQSVATVTSDGQIVAVGSGTCTIYVYAANGRVTSMTITVK